MNTNRETQLIPSPLNPSLYMDAIRIGQQVLLEQGSKAAAAMEIFKIPWSEGFWCSGGPIQKCFFIPTFNPRFTAVNVHLLLPYELFTVLFLIKSTVKVVYGSRG